jgi:hypothetical protein
MTRRSTPTADTRAAFAALARPFLPELEIDRYLVVEDFDEVTSEIRTILSERSPRGLEVPS